MFYHINYDEKCMPDPILILPELQNQLNDEFLMFSTIFLTFSKNLKITIFYHNLRIFQGSFSTTHYMFLMVF